MKQNIQRIISTIVILFISALTISARHSKRNSEKKIEEQCVVSDFIKLTYSDITGIGPSEKGGVASLASINYTIHLATLN